MTDWTAPSPIDSSWTAPSSVIPILYDDATIQYDLSYVCYDGYADENWADPSRVESTWNADTSLDSTWDSTLTTETTWS